MNGMKSHVTDAGLKAKVSILTWGMQEAAAQPIGQSPSTACDGAFS